MSIRIGLAAPALQLAPEDFWRWVDLCEHGGIDSLWHSDSLIGESLEPVAMLAALAARTTRMRFGTSTLVAAFRDPVVLAKQCATIDWLSSGRLLPAFGVGIAHDPMWGATGQAPGERGARSNEVIALVRALLEQEQVQFAGRFYRYEGPGVWPRPARRIPLWIGGESDAAVRRTAQLGDGWIGGLSTVAGAGETVRRIRAAAAARVIDDDHYGVTLPARIGSPDHPAVAAVRRRFAKRRQVSEAEVEGVIAGETPEVLAQMLQAYVAVGIAKFVLVPIAQDFAELMAQTRRLAEEVLPLVEDRA